MTVVSTLKPNIELYSLIIAGGYYYIETSSLVCSANQWTGFYMTGTPVMKELMNQDTT